MNKNVELRAVDYNGFSFDDDNLNVSGYANKTGQQSEVLGFDDEQFIEIMNPGVFTDALQEADYVDFYYEHDPDKVLATTTNGSLSLVEDNIGLRMSANVVNTSWGRDAYQMIKQGMIKGMSFGMIVLDDSWDYSGDLPVRTINKIMLFEVSAVRFPAYADSTIEARNNLKKKVESRGLNLVKQTKVPKPKEDRDMPDSSSAASYDDLVAALSANTDTLNGLSEAINNLAYNVKIAVNDTESRDKQTKRDDEDKEELSKDKATKPKNDSADDSKDTKVQLDANSEDDDSAETKSKTDKRDDDDDDKETNSKDSKKDDEKRSEDKESDQENKEERNTEDDEPKEDKEERSKEHEELINYFK